MTTPGPIYATVGLLDPFMLLWVSWTHLCYSGSPRPIYATLGLLDPFMLLWVSYNDYSWAQVLAT
jgi:hypothetical protein